ncbi:MAG: Ycf66 family protein, partial [Prochlorotrichaceae cyanobacterium]
MLSPALPPTLSLVLALVVGFGSLFCFSLGFVAPHLYRRQDLVWSGVGLFYALILWFCSAQIRGAILLGTIANVALLGWLGSQAYLSRWEHLTEAAKAEGAIKWFRIWGQKMTHFIESSVVRVAKSRSAQPSPVRWVRSPKPEVVQGAA